MTEAARSGAASVDSGEMSIATTWGTTESERGRVYHCDAILPNASALYRGVSVAAEVAVVFRWLCQLRVAPYSYDWIDNFGRRSPGRLTPGLEDLEVGQRVMRIFELVSFAPGQHMTLLLRRGRWVFGDLAVTYAVLRAGDGTRLLAKLVVRYPRGPIGWLMRGVLPWGDLIMMRRQLLNLKRLAEHQGQESAA